ncbi:MAG: alpha/beta hydrolase [Sphingorhabdus sp.]|uniref:alpha/beta fold hydrolase n=1 Tax=Sphingorhabdus sp. TaxID=1902408 RepID=UPI003CBBD451
MSKPVEHHFAAPGGELCWFEWGSAGAHPTLLLLHATGFHARCWDATIKALPEDWHYIALDLRGHGRSYRPDSLSDWLVTADDVAAFAQEKLHKTVFAIGHSMGGYVAARTAVLEPDKVAGLLLVDPVMMTPETYAVEAENLVGSPSEHPVARRRNAWESAEQMTAHFANREPYARWRLDVLSDYCLHGLVPAANGEGFELACPPALEASAYMGSWRNNPYGWIGEIKCPTTVLRARNAERAGPMDFSISPTAQDLATQISGATDIHWNEVSHFIPMEEPDRLALLIKQLISPDS